jgi:hypothetical protein
LLSTGAIWPAVLDEPRCRKHSIGSRLRRPGTFACTLFFRLAPHLLEAGYDIRRVQELLGHSSVETTMVHTHVLSQGRSPLDPLAGAPTPVMGGGQVQPNTARPQDSRPAQPAPAPRLDGKRRLALSSGAKQPYEVGFLHLPMKTLSHARPASEKPLLPTIWRFKSTSSIPKGNSFGLAVRRGNRDPRSLLLPTEAASLRSPGAARNRLRNGMVRR